MFACSVISFATLSATLTLSHSAILCSGNLLSKMTISGNGRG